MKHSKPDVVVESSITVLGLLSYVHSKQAYKSIFAWIEKVFSYYVDEILNNLLSPVHKAANSYVRDNTNWTVTFAIKHTRAKDPR